MDKITLRLEAARIAAQLTGVSTKNFIPVARRVERYIEGTAKLEEHFSEEDAVRHTVREAMLEMTGASDTIRTFNEMEKNFHEKYKDFAPTQDRPDRADDQPPTERKEDLHVFPNGLVIRKPHPNPQDGIPRTQPITVNDEWRDPFRWMPQYPDTLSRQMLQATGSCLADDNRTSARNAPTTMGDGVQYLAPGGIPSTEAESIFLQADGEKVE